MPDRGNDTLFGMGGFRVLVAWPYPRRCCLGAARWVRPGHGASVRGTQLVPKSCDRRAATLGRPVST